MAKPKNRYVWVQRYCRRLEEYMVKVPTTATKEQIMRFVELRAGGQIVPQSEETLELSVTFDKPATEAEVRKFKKEAAVML